jgi:hypothetical protein
VIQWKSKLKNQMARIEEINFDLYESVIPGIETLHFTSWQGRSSIAALGRNSDVLSQRVKKV